MTCTVEDEEEMATSEASNQSIEALKSDQPAGE
jgi:hypothetical protein